MAIDDSSAIPTASPTVPSVRLADSDFDISSLAGPEVSRSHLLASQSLTVITVRRRELPVELLERDGAVLVTLIILAKSLSSYFFAVCFVDSSVHCILIIQRCFEASSRSKCEVDLF